MIDHNNKLVMTTTHQPTTLRYNRETLDHGLDAVSEMALSYQDLGFSDIPIGNPAILQRSIDVGVTCYFMRDMCTNIWYNCCKGCHKGCGTVWGCLVQPLFCLFGVPIWCCCRKTVAQALTEAAAKTAAEQKDRHATEEENAIVGTLV